MYILKKFLGNNFDYFNSIIANYNLEQNTYINMTACVSYPFQEVLDVQAMPLATIPTEGTRGKRYFPIAKSIEDIENYAEELGLKLFNIQNSAYKISVQPNSGTQANQIIYNAILNSGDTVLALNPKDGGHISHTKLGCRDIRPVYFPLNEDLDIDYESLEHQIINENPKLVIVGASSYIKEFDYEKIYAITSRYKVPLMADICHSVLYIMGNVHKKIFPYVDFATFTMDKLLRGPQGGVLIYKEEYSSKIDSSIFPKTQGGPIQNSLFSKAMCFLKLCSMNVQEYAEAVISNTNLVIHTLNARDIAVLNNTAHNHIILADVTPNAISGKEAETLLFENGLIVNRNQIPNDKRSALVSSGIRIGTVPITNLNYSEDDVIVLANYIADVLNHATPRKDDFIYLIEKYHKNINISN